MLFKTPGPAILVAHERHSRITLALPQSRLRAQHVADDLVHLFESFAPRLEKKGFGARELETVLVDNPRRILAF